MKNSTIPQEAFLTDEEEGWANAIFIQSATTVQLFLRDAEKEDILPKTQPSEWSYTVHKQIFDTVNESMPHSKASSTRLKVFINAWLVVAAASTEYSTEDSWLDTETLTNTKLTFNVGGKKSTICLSDTAHLSEKLKGYPYP